MNEDGHEIILGLMGKSYKMAACPSSECPWDVSADALCSQVRGMKTGTRLRGTGNNRLRGGRSGRGGFGFSLGWEGTGEGRLSESQLGQLYRYRFPGLHPIK